MPRETPTATPAAPGARIDGETTRVRHAARASARSAMASAPMAGGSAPSVTASVLLVMGSGLTVTGLARTVMGSVLLVMGSVRLVMGSGLTVTGRARTVMGSGPLATASGRERVDRHPADRGRSGTMRAVSAGRDPRTSVGRGVSGPATAAPRAATATLVTPSGC